MPDESLDILIRTKAEIQGAQQASTALTRISGRIALSRGLGIH